MQSNMFRTTETAFWISIIVLGAYAELIHKINNFSNTEYLSFQHKDLIYQKDFMDFVCKSFALRLERRRNILITSLRFFRLVSEYFDKTGEVFDSLVMKSNVADFNSAAYKLKELRESQAGLGKSWNCPDPVCLSFIWFFNIRVSKLSSAEH